MGFRGVNDMDGSQALQHAHIGSLGAGVHERTRLHVRGQCFRVPMGERQPKRKRERELRDGQFMMDGRTEKDTRQTGD